MANYERHSSGLPMIVKFVEHFHNGVQSHTLSRYAIGYIVRGEKHIYNGDKRQTISDRKSTRLNSSHKHRSRMPSSA